MASEYMADLQGSVIATVALAGILWKLSKKLRWVFVLTALGMFAIILVGSLFNTPLLWMICIVIALAIFITGVVKFWKIEKEEKKAG